MLTKRYLAIRDLITALYLNPSGIGYMFGIYYFIYQRLALLELVYPLIERLRVIAAIMQTLIPITACIDPRVTIELS